MTKAEPRGAGLLRSSALVGALTLVSRVFGLLRDVVIASLAGATSGADAFFVAFKIPNFLRRLFAEGAFAQAFVPVLSEYRSQRSRAETKALIDATAGGLGAVLALVTLVGVLGAEAVAWLFAPGFAQDPDKLALTADLLRITFPYLFFISLTAFAGSVLNAFEHYAAPAFTPVLLNLSLIGAAVLFAPRLEVPVEALAWGVLAAGLAQCLFQLPFLARRGLVPRPAVRLAHAGTRRIARLMVPALFGVSVSQINLLLDTILASFLVTGSVSWLYYSDRLVELPLGVIGVAVATVILPVLSRRFASGDADAFAHTLDWALRLVLLIGLPAGLALMVLAEPVLFTLFQYGELTPVDVVRSAASLRAYALGLLAFMLIKVLAPGYYARQNTRTPVRIGIYAMVVNMALNLVLIWPLAHVGLALATALSAWLNAGLLWRGLRRSGNHCPGQGWGAFIGRTLLANGLMVAALLWATPDFASWAAASVQWRIGVTALLCAGGGLVYLGVLWSTGLRLNHLRPG
ncbi:MAG: murein biosynthesis integral membrane protein MurJ [Pseudomonadota bacterium]|nr:murein biosynthesis integral membrane protein MurJ [Pseudomonadota bacterium]